MATRGDAALVTGRADASGTYLSSGIAAHSYRVPFSVHADAHSIRIVFANRRLVRTVGECDGADAVTVRAVLEDPRGGLWPVLFGGRDEGRMEPGGELAADALPVLLRRCAMVAARHNCG